MLLKKTLSLTMLLKCKTIGKLRGWNSQVGMPLSKNFGVPSVECFQPHAFTAKSEYALPCPGVSSWLGRGVTQDIYKKGHHEHTWQHCIVSSSALSGDANVSSQTTTSTQSWWRRQRSWPGVRKGWPLRGQGSRAAHQHGPSGI